MILVMEFVVLVVSEVLLVVVALDQYKVVMVDP